MPTDKHDPESEGTELAADNIPHSAQSDNKKSGDLIDTATCCRGMSCRKKIILAATAALALFAITLACSRWCRHCRHGNKDRVKPLLKSSKLRES
ncbi:MAG: hypothetical protein ABSE00_01870 [Chitinispirillaceae bacterium]